MQTLQSGFFMSEKLKSFVYKPFLMFKELICIQRRRSEQENSWVESKEQNCNNLSKFQGRGAMGRGRGTLGRPPQCKKYTGMTH